MKMIKVIQMMTNGMLNSSSYFKHMTVKFYFLRKIRKTKVIFISYCLIKVHLIIVS